MQLQMSSAPTRAVVPCLDRTILLQHSSSENHQISRLESALAILGVSVDSKRLGPARSCLQILYLQHLQAPSVTVANKHLISPLKSALARFLHATPLESALTKKIGGGQVPIGFSIRATPNSSVGSNYPLNRVSAGRGPQATSHGSLATDRRQ
jgi:hypothetical protein